MRRPLAACTPGKHTRGQLAEQRENELAYLREHRELLADHLGEFVGYHGGERLIGPMPDGNELERMAMEQLKASDAKKGVMLNIFQIRKSIAGVELPEV